MKPAVTRGYEDQTSSYMLTKVWLILWALTTVLVMEIQIIRAIKFHASGHKLIACRAWEGIFSLSLALCIALHTWADTSERLRVEAAGFTVSEMWGLVTTGVKMLNHLL